jgi:hypothetical protein
MVEVTRVDADYDDRVLTVSHATGRDPPAETRIMFGKAATEELEVTALEQGRTYTVKAGGRGADYTSVWSVESDSDQTTLTMTFSAETTGLVANVVALTPGDVFEGATRKALEKDFDDILAGLAD